MAVTLTYVDAAGTSYQLNSSGRTLRALRGEGIPDIVHQVVRTPNRDGETLIRSLYEPRFLTALVTLAAADWSALQTARVAMAAALNPRAGIGEIRYQPVAAGTTYTIPAILESFGRDVPGSKLERVPLVFRCPDPAWRVSPINSEELLTGGSGITVPITVPIDILAGAPYPITNAGHLDSPPVFTITGGVTNPLVRNATSDKTFQLDVTIAVGQTAVIDMGARTAVRSDGLNLMPYRTSESQMWSLVPGVNSIEVGFFSAPATPVSFEIEWYTRLAGV